MVGLTTTLGLEKVGRGAKAIQKSVAGQITSSESSCGSMVFSVCILTRVHDVKDPSRFTT